MKRKLKPAQLPEVYRLLRRSFGHQKWWPGETPFEVIVGAILTQNTAWTNVEKAIRNLKTEGKLSPETIRDMKHAELAKLIRPAGYFNIKAKRLKAFIDFFYKNYGGEIERMSRERGPVLRRKLLEVSGIGPETADSILLYVTGKPFFVIDAYTKRIFSRHDLHDAASDYHDWQALFEKALPRSRALFNDFHAQIVHVGKNYCKASRVFCDACPLKIYF